MKSLSFALLLPILLLSACSYFDGEKEKAPLAGERISILDLQKELHPTAVTSNITIEIPAAVTNENWSQAGSYPHHAMQNLALNTADQLQLAWKADIGAGSENYRRFQCKIGYNGNYERKTVLFS